MLYCPKCHAPVNEGDKFCSKCAHNVEIKLKNCGNCGKLNPADAPYCYGCGQPLFILELSPQLSDVLSRFDFTIPKRLEEQIKDLFFEEIKRLGEWLRPTEQKVYLDELTKSSFLRTVALRAQQLAEELSDTYHKQGSPSVIRLEKNLENAVISLALYFIVYHCKPLNPTPLSEAIIKYENAVRGNVNLGEMIMDYLNLEKKQADYFTNFVAMPAQKMTNAAKHFLFKSKDEHLFIIFDLSPFGGCKEGLAITEFGIYWKMVMQKPHQVYFHQLGRLDRVESWIEINTHTLNAGKTVNIKLLLLLDKLMRMYS